jgi:hypothetical protein
MLTLVREQAADQILGKTQWWSAKGLKFLVRWSRDGWRCGIYVYDASPPISAELLFDRLHLSSRAGFTLEPGIDCMAIGCPAHEIEPTLNSLSAVAEAASNPHEFRALVRLAGPEELHTTVRLDAWSKEEAVELIERERGAGSVVRVWDETLAKIPREGS